MFPSQMTAFISSEALGVHIALTLMHSKSPPNLEYGHRKRQVPLQRKCMQSAGSSTTNCPSSMLPSVLTSCDSEAWIQKNAGASILSALQARATNGSATKIVPACLCLFLISSSLLFSNAATSQINKLDSEGWVVIHVGKAHAKPGYVLLLQFTWCLFCWGRAFVVDFAKNDFARAVCDLLWLRLEHNSLNIVKNWFGLPRQPLHQQNGLR